jgi:hypothetical protein
MPGYAAYAVTKGGIGRSTTTFGPDLICYEIGQLPGIDIQLHGKVGVFRRRFSNVTDCWQID